MRLAPHNALAYARFAKLWLAAGHLDNAVAAAQQTVALQPLLARMQSVVGFAYLTQLETAAAMVEAQHLLRIPRMQLLSGVGHFKARRSSVLRFFPTPPLSEEADIRHANLYVYAQLNYPLVFARFTLAFS